MTTPVIETISDVQGQIIVYVGKAKDPLTSGVSTVVDFVTDHVSSIPAMPFADQIPTPKEIIDNQYKFTKQFIDAQKALALSVAKAAAPVTDQVLDRSTPTRKTASSAASKAKSTATKTAAKAKPASA